MSKVNRILIIAIATALALTAIFSPLPIQAQDSEESPNLARFVALMQDIRSEPAPADVHPNNVAQLAVFDAAFSGIYITGFITPFTGESAEVELSPVALPDLVSHLPQCAPWKFGGLPSGRCLNSGSHSASA